MVRFKEFDILWDPVNSFTDLVEDSQAIAMDFFPKVEHPQKGWMRIPATPIQFSRTPKSIRKCAPALGEHTSEILQGLGYSPEAFAQLAEEGIVK